MKNSRDGKSYSTNLAFTPPEYLRTGNYYKQELDLWYFQVVYDRVCKLFKTSMCVLDILHQDLH